MPRKLPALTSKVFVPIAMHSLYLERKRNQWQFFGSSRIEDIFYEAMLWRNMSCELSPPLTTHLITQLHEILIFCLCSYYTVVYGAVTCFIYIASGGLILHA